MWRYRTQRPCSPTFIRVSQFKEQLEADEEEEDIVMTTLSCLPRSWDSFIQGICAKKNLITFSRLWEECTQEEAWLITREENMDETKDQALMVQKRKRRFLKRWGICTLIQKDSTHEEPLIHIIIWIRKDAFVKEEYDGV